LRDPSRDLTHPAGYGAGTAP